MGLPEGGDPAAVGERLSLVGTTLSKAEPADEDKGLVAGEEALSLALLLLLYGEKRCWRKRSADDAAPGDAKLAYADANRGEEPWCCAANANWAFNNIGFNPRGEAAVAVEAVGEVGDVGDEDAAAAFNR